MKKLKNKKSIVFVVLVLFIGLIGGTFAYYTSSHVFENVFHTNPYQTEVIETFISPDDWLPGTTTPKEVAVTNKGSVNVGVRISFTEEWEDANGDPLPLKDSENRPIAVINFASDLSNWNEVVEDGTTYYYYTEELEPNETTDPLIESVTFRSDLDMNVDSSCTTTGNITECSTMIDGHIG